MDWMREEWKRRPQSGGASRRASRGPETNERPRSDSTRSLSCPTAIGVGRASMGAGRTSRTASVGMKSACRPPWRRTTRNINELAHEVAINTGITARAFPMYSSIAKVDIGQSYGTLRRHTCTVKERPS